TVLRRYRAIALGKAAILPLVPRNEEMVARSRALLDELRSRWLVEYDDGGQIGRRYRRQDEIGTPWAFTIDEQTLEDETVTVRDRDSLAQERVPLSGGAGWLQEAAPGPLGVSENVKAFVLVGALALLAAGCGGTKTVTDTTTVTKTVTVHETTTVGTTGGNAANACTGDAMSGTFNVIAGSAGAGQISYRLTVTNTSPVACYVSGLPHVHL